jgi:hypothetical protein
VWKCVETAFADTYWEEERNYWDFALGLRDSWENMSRAPAKVVQNTVSEVAELAEKLANKIVTFNPEIRTLKGHADAEQSMFLVDDLIAFAKSLREKNDPTEAMRSRPRSMALASAERTYMARALTHFLLSGVTFSGKPFPRRNTIVAMTVTALLDIGQDDEFDEKDVSDVTEDIVKHYRTRLLE